MLITPCTSPDRVTFSFLDFLCFIFSLVFVASCLLLGLTFHNLLSLYDIRRVKVTPLIVNQQSRPSSTNTIRALYL
jgi:hypothetical protein